MQLQQGLRCVLKGVGALPQQLVKSITPETRETHHTSHITHHTSRITHHASHITHHTACTTRFSEAHHCRNTGQRSLSPPYCLRDGQGLVVTVAGVEMIGTVMLVMMMMAAAAAAAAAHLSWNLCPNDSHSFSTSTRRPAPQWVQCVGGFGVVVGGLVLGVWSLEFRDYPPWCGNGHQA
jgi:hypothetical protein